MAEDAYPVIDQHSMRQENEFWLGILKDHTMFIQDSLIPRETQLIAQAKQFQQIFEALLFQANRGELNPQEAIQATCQFRNYKIAIVNMQLMGQNPINLPPGALGEMLDEDLAYLNILQGRPPMSQAQFLFEQHLLWLPNQAAHAALAASQLDPSEMTLFNKFEHFHLLFHELQLKAEELKNLTAGNPQMVPPLVYLTRESAGATREFLALLDQYLPLRSTGQVMAITPPVLIDHFMREANYYLGKIGGCC